MVDLVTLSDVLSADPLQRDTIPADQNINPLRPGPLFGLNIPVVIYSLK